MQPNEPKIEGHVFDMKSGVPIEHAKVTLYQKRKAVVVLTTYTDSDGKFSCDRPQLPELLLKAEAFGQESEQKSVSADCSDMRIVILTQFEPAKIYVCTEGGEVPNPCPFLRRIKIIWPVSVPNYRTKNFASTGRYSSGGGTISSHTDRTAIIRFSTAAPATIVTEINGSRPWEDGTSPPQTAPGRKRQRSASTPLRPYREWPYSVLPCGRPTKKTFGR